MASDSRPRIAVFAGPTATVLNSAPLVTSNLARRRHGLPERSDAWGRPLRFDALRPQRLARAVTVYVEQFSAHPLEADASELYGEPDGYVDADGEFQRERSSAQDVPVYEITLSANELVPLPYMATQRDGTPWEDDGARPGAPPAECRQPFYPDASRVFEEIDRLGVGGDGLGNQLGSRADYDFLRVVPSSGFTKGLPASLRTDTGQGDIPRERIWEDFFPYRPAHLRREVPRDRLATVTNTVQQALASGAYRGGIWLEGSPSVEETTYWLNLLIDTSAPIVGCAAPESPHGTTNGTGDRNILSSVRYICSDAWADESGTDRIGAVLIDADTILAARDAQKGDARPGGYLATGGHGGVLGSVGTLKPYIAYTPARRHTGGSALRLSALPEAVDGVTAAGDAAAVTVRVPVKDRHGALLGSALPYVSIVKHARYLGAGAGDDPSGEVEILARIKDNLRTVALAGFVVEGGAPFGVSSQTVDAALRQATLRGMPVVRVGRGDASGFVPQERMRLCIAGSNLTATKARLLLMACLLRLGALPPARDPNAPTELELDAIQQRLNVYQEIFDTH